MKVFDSFFNGGVGVLYFSPKDCRAYEKGKACYGFGSVRYAEGSVYVGDLYFDGDKYNKLGYGRQDFARSTLGALKYSRAYGEYRVAFYAGEYDYRKTDWIYGNGVLYFVTADNRPLGFTKGFFQGLTLTGEYEGVFDCSALAYGYDAGMEIRIDERYELLLREMNNIGNINGGYNLFLGDSYIEFWQYADIAGGNAFYSVFDEQRNLNLGLGGTTFYDWLAYGRELAELSAPRNIAVNLGFNDIHCGRTADEAYAHCKRFVEMLHALFNGSRVYLLNVVSAPSYTGFQAEEERFNALIASNASDIDVTVLDVRTRIAELRRERECFIEDGVHLDAAGYKILSDIIVKELQI